MEFLQKFVRTIPKDAKSGSLYNNLSGGSGGGLTDALSSSDQSRIIVSRPPRQAVSLLTCSKLCMFFFVAGVVVGYTIKRRVKRWASKLLKRLKDD
ncbi:hypothetical protein LWI29_031533 [Acer saccharum]|uniref:Transmembrane protein n=1 Tax=Acer saccharum TaxID=4024 RepID=A0AA39V9Y0_ACESA|nr:hypothetical protein LWI29_031533 [Acer saccharum]